MTDLYAEVQQSPYRTALKEGRDCAVVALAIAGCVPYKVMHEGLRLAGRRRRGGASTEAIKCAAKWAGLTLTDASSKLPTERQATVSTVGRYFPTGRYLVFVRGHVFALVDGMVQDWTAGRKHRVKYVYEVSGADPNRYPEEHVAHIVKDCMNHFAIEINRTSKKVHCLVRINGAVEFKTYPLDRSITDADYPSNDGTYTFDARWQRCTPETDPGVTLDRVLDSFTTGGLDITDKARRMMEALRADPSATEPVPQTQPDQGDSDMSKKKVKVKKAKKEVVKGYKGLRPGSAIEKLAKYHDEKKPERAEFIAYAEKQGVSKASAAGAWQFIKNGFSKTKK